MIAVESGQYSAVYRSIGLSVIRWSRDSADCLSIERTIVLWKAPHR